MLFLINNLIIGCSRVAFFDNCINNNMNNTSSDIHDYKNINNYENIDDYNNVECFKYEILMTIMFEKICTTTMIFKNDPIKQIDIAILEHDFDKVVNILNTEYFCDNNDMDGEKKYYHYLHLCGSLKMAYELISVEDLKALHNLLPKIVVDKFNHNNKNYDFWSNEFKNFIEYPLFIVDLNKINTIAIFIELLDHLTIVYDSIKKTISQLCNKIITEKITNPKNKLLDYQYYRTELLKYGVIITNTICDIIKITITQYEHKLSTPFEYELLFLILHIIRKKKEHNFLSIITNNTQYEKIPQLAIETNNLMIINMIFYDSIKTTITWIKKCVFNAIKNGKLKRLILIVNNFLVYYKSLEYIDKIITEILNTHEEGNNIYHLAVKGNHPKIIEYISILPHNKEMVNESNRDGETPIYLACFNGYINCVQELLILHPYIGGILIVIADNIEKWKQVKNSDKILKMLHRYFEAIIKKFNISNPPAHLKLLFNMEQSKISYFIDFCYYCLFAIQTYYFLNSIDVTLETKIFFNFHKIIDEIDNINIKYDYFEKIFSTLYTFCFEDRIDNQLVPDFDITINNEAHGVGVIRYILDEFSTFLVKESGLLAPIFYSDNDFNDTIKIYSLFDVGNDYMYIPYYEEPISNTIKFHYFYMGILLGLSFLYTPVEMHLSPIFYLYLAREKKNIIEALPRYMVFQIQNMLTYTKEDFKNADLDMTIRSYNSKGEIKEYELVENGKNIIIDNIEDYIEALIYFYYNAGQRKEILDIIANGFSKVLNTSEPISSVFLYLLINKKNKRSNIFDWIKYTYIICSREFLVNDESETETEINIKENNVSFEINASNIKRLNIAFCRKYEDKLVPNVVVWFFQIVDELNDSEYDNLINFITGSSSLPLGGISGLYNIGKPIRIEYLHNISSNNDSRLPTSSTCMTTIKLPQYTSKDAMSKCIKKALECNTLDFV